MLGRNEQVGDDPKGEERESIILRCMYYGVTECISEQKERNSWAWKRHIVGIVFDLCLFVFLFYSKGNLPSSIVVESIALVLDTLG